MEGSRGKRGKKPAWQVSVGVKDVVFAGFGVVGLMMISFAIGVLAGRGDIYRVFYQWGLLGPETARVAQWTPPPGTPGASLPGGAVPAPGVAAAPAAAPGAAPAAKAPTGVAPVTGSIADMPSSTPAAKKGKAAASTRDQKAREEEMRRVRQEVVRKLKFQNSLDGQPKGAKAAKPKEKAPAKPALVKVAQFRDQKAAKAKVAELQKKGVKATLKEGKDQKGPLYTVYKPAPAASSPGSESLAKSPEKKRKPPDE